MSYTPPTGSPLHDIADVAGVMRWPDGSVHIPQHGEPGISDPLAAAQSQIRALDALTRAQRVHIAALGTPSYPPHPDLPIEAQIDSVQAELNRISIAYADAAFDPADDEGPLDFYSDQTDHLHAQLDDLRARKETQDLNDASSPALDHLDTLSAEQHRPVEPYPPTEHLTAHTFSHHRL